MPNLENTNSAYLELIGQAIGDFDKIYGKLVDKGVATYGTADGTGTYSTGVATSEYADLIGKLYAIKDKTTSAYVYPATPHITRLSEITATSATLNPATGNIELTSGAEGFVQTDAKFKTSFETLSLTESSLTRTAKKDSDGEPTGVYHYSYTTPANKIVKDISIKEGSVTLDFNAGTHSKSATSAAIGTLDLKLGTIASGVIVDAIPTNGNENDYLPFTIQPDVTVGCEHNFSIETGKGYDFTSGYITNIDTTKLSRTFSDSATVTADGASTLYLKKATLSNVTATGDIGFSDSDIDAATGDSYYEVKASAAINVDGTISAGYIGSGQKIEGSGSASSTFKVLKTSLADVEITGNTIAVDGDLIDGIKTADSAEASGYYNVEVSIPAIDKDVTAAEGYIKDNGNNDDGRKFNISAAADKTYINIKQGYHTVSSSASITGGDLATTGAAATHTEFEVTITSSVDSDFGSGYITAPTVTTPSTQTQKLYIPNATNSTKELNISATAYNIGDDDGIHATGTTESPVNLFVETAPTDGDYYEIKAESFVTLSSGYISSQSDYDSVEYLYLPKAKLEYVEDDTLGNLVTVTSGGYLPAGVLTDISHIEGNLDEASVITSINGGITYVDIDANDPNKGQKKIYRVTAALNESTFDAGYFFGAKNYTGAVWDVNAGSVVTTASVTGTEAGTVVAEGNNAYKVNITASGIVNTTITDGYIQGNDLKVNDSAGQNAADVTFSGNTSISLNKAVIVNSTDTKVGVKATSAELEKVTENSKYVVTVGLDTNNNTINATVNADGYIKTTDVATLNVTTDGASYAIKEGSVGAITNTENSGSVTLVDNFGDELGANENYTINIAPNSTVAATATITEGYVDGGSASGSVNVTGTISVAHGQITSSVTSSTTTSNVITGTNGIRLYGTSAEASAASAATNGVVYQINAKDTISTTANIVKAGFVKEGDIVAAQDVESTGSMFIAGYNGQATNDGPFEINNAFIGDDGEPVYEEVLATGQKYVARDIKIALSGDAMGSNVVAQLQLLRARLNGDKVTVVTSNVTPEA